MKIQKYRWQTPKCLLDMKETRYVMTLSSLCHSLSTFKYCIVKNLTVARMHDMIMTMRQAVGLHLIKLFDIANNQKSELT